MKTILMVQLCLHSIVTDDGNVYYPSHGTPLWLINEFINFLRNCGGFSIW